MAVTLNRGLVDVDAAQTVQYSWELFQRLDPKRTPLFSRCALAPAHGFRVSWAYWLPERQALVRCQHENFTQIVRCSFRFYDSEPNTRYYGQSVGRERRKKAVEFVRQVENVLRFGEPSYREAPQPRHTCGGWHHWNERSPIEADRLILLSLREPVLRREREKRLDEWTEEFIGEFSFVFVPAY